MHRSQKKEKLKKILGEITTWILILLSAASLFLPYSQYKYKSSIYTLNGLEMFTGKMVMKKTVEIAPVRFLILIAIAAGIAALLTLLHETIHFLNEKQYGRSLCLAAVIQIGCEIVFIVRVKDFMDGTKKAGIAFGILTGIVLSLLLLVRGVILLYRKGYLCMLDFMVVPGLLYIFINNYLPMVGITFAFKKIDFSVGVWRSAWCGFDNFKYLFSTKDAFIITRNTLAYNAVFIVLSNILGILVGICLCEISKKWLKKVSQSCILLPQLISAVIISYIVFGFLSAESGFINKSIITDGYIDFYNTRVYWPFIIVFVYLWKQIGYSSMIYLSSIVGIDRSLYEASYIDGCSRWNQIRYVTLPLLKPTIITLVLLQVGRIFYSDFGLFYQVPMDSGSLYRVTNTIDTYVYRSLMQNNNVSMSAAASAYQAVLGFIIVIIANLVVRKVDKDSAML